ncbi:MAG: PD40 domain-containing protein [Planctomycetes bacterium]|nr:PD40 domain-containing protein [Planctomycetota bacterium]
MRSALAFCCLALAGALAAQQPAPAQPAAKPVLDPKDGAPGARFPSLSPDGKTVVFTLWGDLWSMPSAGGRASRLTFHEAYDTRPLITPDGREIVFLSDRAGSYDIWVMPIDGGAPRRLTFHAAADVPTGFTTDGKHVLFYSTRTLGWSRGGQYETWRIPLAGGTPVQLTQTGGREASTSDDGTTLYYVDGASDTKVQEYKGSANDRLYRQVKGQAPEEILLYDGNSREPSISPDGKRLHFTREVNGSFELFICDHEKNTCAQVTSLGEDGLSQVSFSPDDSTIVFVWKFYLYSLDLKTAGAKPKLLKIEIREDLPSPATVERTFSEGIARASLSFDGRFITFALAGDVWIMSADGGEARPLTNDSFNDDNPRLSPDGKTISFYSNRSGNSDIWLMDANGSNLRQFTNHAADDFFQTWSPDSQALVFCSTRSGNKDIWLQRVDGTAPVQLTSHAADDDDPSFSPDGRFIAFDSNRGGNADIYVMDADGKNQRRVYGTPAVEEVPAFSPDGRFLVFDRVTQSSTFVRQEVIVTDLIGSGEVLLGAGAYASYTPDGRNIVYVNREGELVEVPAPVGITSGRTIPFLAKRRTTEKEEMLRAFDEAHQSWAQTFYDPKFHGKDWVELGRKYRALVEACGCREEYLSYLNRMVGEVSASHSGAFASTMKARPTNTGQLGISVTPEAMTGGRQRLRVDDVERGSPADAAWVRKGDYIFRVDGKPLTMTDNFYALLEGKEGKEVSLFVADNPDGRNFREVKVTTEGFQQRQQRSYQRFLQTCREETARKSRGQVAYLHIAGMMPNNLTQFQNELANPAVQQAKALIIDVRDNGGGNIHQELIDILSRKPYAYIQMRNGQRVGQPNVYWNRPIVVLINERSYSDAEVFPHAMKTLGMATIIGVATPGAVIGTNDIKLSDGTNWRLPRSGFFNVDGTNQEHNGCQPHIAVEITPADKLAGRDPQLEKAVEVLLDKLRQQPQPGPQQPTQPGTPAKEGEFSAPAVKPEAATAE